MTEVGREVRRLREARGWNQAKLAVEAGMAPSAVNQIENGKRSPSASSLTKLAGALGVEVRDLFPLGQAPLLDLGEERRRAERDKLAEGLPGWIRAAAEDPEFVRRFETAKRSLEAADQLATEEHAAQEEASRRVRDLKRQEAPAGDVQRARRDLQQAKTRHHAAKFLSVDVWRGKDVSDKRAVDYAAELASTWRAQRAGELFASAAENTNAEAG